MNQKKRKSKGQCSRNSKNALCDQSHKAMNNQQTQQMLYSFQNKDSLSFTSHISKGMYDSANQVNFMSPQCLSNISQRCTPNKSNQQSYENEIRRLLNDFNKNKDCGAMPPLSAIPQIPSKATKSGQQVIQVSKFAQNHRNSVHEQSQQQVSDQNEQVPPRNGQNAQTAQNVQTEIKRAQIVWSKDPLQQQSVRGAQSFSPDKIKRKLKQQPEIVYQNVIQNAHKRSPTQGEKLIVQNDGVAANTDSNAEPVNRANSVKQVNQNVYKAEENNSSKYGMSSVIFGSYPVSSQRSQNDGLSSQNKTGANVSHALSSKKDSQQTSEVALQNVISQQNNANLEQSFQDAEGMNEFVKLDNIQIRFNGQQNDGGPDDQLCQNVLLENRSPDFQCNQNFGNNALRQGVQVQIKPKIPKKSHSTSAKRKKTSFRQSPQQENWAQNSQYGQIAYQNGKNYDFKSTFQIFASPEQKDRKLISKKFLSQAKENSKILNALRSTNKKVQVTKYKNNQRLRTEVSQHDRNFNDNLVDIQRNLKLQKVPSSRGTEFKLSDASDSCSPIHYFNGVSASNFYCDSQVNQPEQQHEARRNSSPSAMDSPMPLQRPSDTVIRNQSPYFETKQKDSKVQVLDQMVARQPLQDISNFQNKKISPSKIQRIVTNKQRSKIILLKPDQIQNSRNVGNIYKNNRLNQQYLERSRTQTQAPNEMSFDKNKSSNMSRSPSPPPQPNIDLIAKLKRKSESRDNSNSQSKPQIAVNISSNSPRSQSLKNLINTQVKSMEDIHFIKVYLKHRENCIRQKMEDTAGKTDKYSKLASSGKAPKGKSATSKNSLKNKENANQAQQRSSTDEKRRATAGSKQLARMKSQYRLVTQREAGCQAGQLEENQFGIRF